MISQALSGLSCLRATHLLVSRKYERENDLGKNQRLMKNLNFFKGGVMLLPVTVSCVFVINQKERNQDDLIFPLNHRKNLFKFLYSCFINKGIIFVLSKQRNLTLRK